MKHHIGHASSHMSLPTSLRRTVPASCPTALAWRESVGLSPLVRGHVDVSGGYHIRFGGVEATNTPPCYYLSFGQDLDRDLIFLARVGDLHTYECPK